MKKILVLSLILSAFAFNSNAQITGGSDARTTPNKEVVSKDYLFKNGFLLDGIVSTGDLTGFAVRIGNRWNFGSHDAFRLGVQAIWARIGIYGGSLDGVYYYDGNYYSESYSRTYVTIAPVNVGFVGTMKFNENVGIEAGLNLGYNIAIDLEGDIFEDEYYDSGYESTSSGVLIN